MIPISLFLNIPLYILQLFGPKWSYNMPKYAANLSVAPLQPQKQSTPSGLSQSEVNSEKNTTKPSSTWSDPFTSDGQECKCMY